MADKTAPTSIPPINSPATIPITGKSEEKISPLHGPTSFKVLVADGTEKRVARNGIFLSIYRPFIPRLK
jgi:hypothetical protein